MVYKKSASIVGSRVGHYPNPSNRRYKGNKKTVNAKLSVDFLHLPTVQFRRLRAINRTLGRLRCIAGARVREIICCNPSLFVDGFYIFAEILLFEELNYD